MRCFSKLSCSTTSLFRVGNFSQSRVALALGGVSSCSSLSSGVGSRCAVSASLISSTSKRFARTPANPPPSQSDPAAEVVLTESLKKDLADMIARDRIVIFLTGTPHQPRCRFTAMLVDMLNQIGIKYSYVNILDDDEVCEGLKLYSNWPTYPQIYIDQELIGGYDICKTMMLNGQLVELLKSKKLL